MRVIDADAFDNVLKDAQTECKKNGGNFRFGVLNNVRANLAKAPTIGGWISVEDRLPDAAGVMVLVTAHNRYYDTYSVFPAFLSYGTNKWCTYDVTKMETKTATDNTVNDRLTVKYWMPLPEPPKVGDDE